jgi:tetratricopeptide (TPR) repeat protein
VAALEKAGLDTTDPANQAVLRALADYLIADGRAEQALAAVDRALARDGEDAALHEMRGVVLMRLGRSGDARSAFEKAVSLGSTRAKAGLGEIAFGEGDAKKAIELYDEAGKADPLDVAPAYAAAQIALTTGDRLGAKQRLEDVVRRDPGHAGAHNDLAWLLAQSGEDLDRALALAQTAYRIDPNPDIADTLGWVHLQRGENEAAVELFEKAVAARPDSPSMRYHLGLALARRGEHQRALETLRKSLEAGPFPEAEAARSELARLESQ